MSMPAEILGALGLSTGIAHAVWIAYTDPTSAAVQRVVDAYAAQGMVIPGKLMAFLISENEKRHPEDTYKDKIIETAAPYAVGTAAIIGVVLFLIFRRRK